MSELKFCTKKGVPISTYPQSCTVIPTGYRETRLDPREAFEDPDLYLHHFTNAHHIFQLTLLPTGCPETRLDLREAFENPFLY